VLNFKVESKNHANSELKASIVSYQDKLYFTAGIFFLAMAKAKNIIKGYSTPKPFGKAEINRCIDYDIQVVEKWLERLRKYSPDESSVKGKNILELGPGEDLGTGLYLLSKGCLRYNACDVNNLISATPDAFYEKLFDKITGSNSETNFLKEELEKTKQGKNSKLNYVVRNDFDIVSAFGEGTMDLVFSQAAFEHFDDVNETISQLTTVCKPGAILIAEIDLKTHSRWIRSKDPNNIYRYPNWIYNAFWFRGIPNRVRPFQYKEILERFGWGDILIVPLSRLGAQACGLSGLDQAFAGPENQMDYLSILLCAKKM
jgi:SAM-dependent methyltransferase